MIKIKKRAKGNVPLGRTLSTYDHYLDRNSKLKKERPLVVIERNKRNELAVVALSSRDGKHRTRLKNYQDGNSYFKHFLETRDNEGKPIKIGAKFRENHPRNDIARRDARKIRKRSWKSLCPQNAIKKRCQNSINKKIPEINHSGQCRHQTRQVQTFVCLQIL